MSIFSKLFKLFITVVLMPLIPMALLLAYYQNRQKDNVLEIHYNLAEIVSSDMDHYVQDVKWRLSFLPQLATIVQGNQNPQEFLHSIIQDNTDFLFLAVLDKNGQETARAARYAEGEKSEKINLTQDGRLAAIASSPNLYLSALETADGALALDFVTPLSENTLLYGVLNIYDLLDRLQQMRIGRTGQVFLTSQQGHIYAGPYQQNPGISAEDLQKRLEGKSRLIKGLQGAEGSLVGAYAYAKPLGLYVTVLQLKNEAWRSLYFFNITLSLFLLSIALLTYFGAQAFSRSLGEPIAELAEGAKAVSCGDLDHRVNEDFGWGEFQGLMASFNKMTADLKDYQALQLKNQVSEMKEHIFRSVAHDLRSPLLGLQGYIYILQSGKINPEQREEYLRRMEEAALNLSSLLEDVLAVSRVEAGMALPQRQSIEITEFLQNVIHDIEPVAQEKGLRLACNDSEGISVYADPKLLRRILTNLLSNAVKFTKEGWIKISVEDQPNQTLISVQDSGIGLSEKECVEIFEKYNQVSSKAEGYGLGLFISRQLARAHGGDLSVQSAPGQGSTFVLMLPKEEK